MKAACYSQTPARRNAYPQKFIRTLRRLADVTFHGPSKYKSNDHQNHKQPSKYEGQSNATRKQDNFGLKNVMKSGFHFFTKLPKSQINQIKYFIILPVLLLFIACNEFAEPISASLRLRATQLLSKKCCNAGCYHFLLR